METEIKKCQECIHSEVTDNVKSGKYRNLVYKCKIHRTVLVLDHWRKTEAISCKDFNK